VHFSLNISGLAQTNDPFFNLILRAMDKGKWTIDNAVCELTPNYEG
jgi:hypothetical protein